MIVKLKRHESANAKVIIHYNKDIELISYNTSVIMASKIDNTAYSLNCSGLYSATTRRHISWFINEYFNHINYYTIKDSVINGNVTLTYITKNI